MKVAVFGLGYVGTVTAACLAANGHDVWGVDIDAAKVEDIRAGDSPVAEPGLDALVARAVATATLHATTSCADALDGADVSLVCVGTPSTARGGTDLSYIRRAVERNSGGAARRGPPASRHHSVVIRSTVPPGTVEDMVAPALTGGLAGTDITVGAGMCPEFLREGSGIADFYASPLTVVGTADHRVAETITSLLGFLDRPVRVVDVRIAEGLKYACNAFHATKVSFANEIARLFRLLGVDSRQVMALFCEDSDLNISPSYLRPGFAFGGSCLPKDLRSLLHLARMSGVDLPLAAGALATNELVIDEAINRVLACDALTVALLGLSFKMNSDDLRESPNVELAERLIGKGFEVRIYDPARQPGSADRRQPPACRVEAAAPAAAARRQPGRGAARSRLAIVSSSRPGGRWTRCSPTRRGPHRPERAAGPLKWSRSPATRGSAGEPASSSSSRTFRCPSTGGSGWSARRSPAGYQVSVVCPKGHGDPAYQVDRRRELYKYRPYAPGGTQAGLRRSNTRTRSPPPPG